MDVASRQRWIGIAMLFGVLYFATGFGAGELAGAAAYVALWAGRAGMPAELIALCVP